MVWTEEPHVGLSVADRAFAEHHLLSANKAIRVWIALDRRSLYRIHTAPAVSVDVVAEFDERFAVGSYNFADDKAVVDGHLVSEDAIPVDEADFAKAGMEDYLPDPEVVAIPVLRSAFGELCFWQSDIGAAAAPTHL